MVTSTFLSIKLFMINPKEREVLRSSPFGYSAVLAGLYLSASLFIKMITCGQKIKLSEVFGENEQFGS